MLFAFASASASVRRPRFIGTVCGLESSPSTNTRLLLRSGTSIMIVILQQHVLLDIAAIEQGGDVDCVPMPIARDADVLQIGIGIRPA